MLGLRGTLDAEACGLDQGHRSLQFRDYRGCRDWGDRGSLAIEGSPGVRDLTASAVVLVVRGSVPSGCTLDSLAAVLPDEIADPLGHGVTALASPGLSDRDRDLNALLDAANDVRLNDPRRGVIWGSHALSRGARSSWPQNKGTRQGPRSQVQGTESQGKGRGVKTQKKKRGRGTTGGEL